MTKQNCRILVVDDVIDWQNTIKGLLEDEGYAVETAGSVSEARQKLQNTFFDLAVLDMRLDETDISNIDGLDKLASLIKAEYPSTKTIIVTGYATEETLKQAMRPNDQGEQLVAFFMEKTETEELIKTIEEVLSQR